MDDEAKDPVTQREGPENGVPCPQCGGEMIDDGGVTFGFPLGTNVYCNHCGYEGVRE